MGQAAWREQNLNRIGMFPVFVNENSELEKLGSTERKGKPDEQDKDSELSDEDDFLMELLNLHRMLRQREKLP